MILKMMNYFHVRIVSVKPTMVLTVLSVHSMLLTTGHRSITAELVRKKKHSA